MQTSQDCIVLNPGKSDIFSQHFKTFPFSCAWLRLYKTTGLVEHDGPRGLCATKVIAARP